MGLFDALTSNPENGGAVASVLSKAQSLILAVVILLFVLTVAGIIFWRKKQAKRYNIPLIIITTRSDGRVTEIDMSGKGAYEKSKSVGGITSFKIKRPGIAITQIPPPPSKYLMGANRVLMLVQKGVDDYEPVLPESLTRVRTADNRYVQILDLKAINQDATAWAFDIEETAKKAFTFTSFWDKHQILVSMMTFVFILFLVMYINWIGMDSVVKGLADVAEQLQRTAAPQIVPTGV